MFYAAWLGRLLRFAFRLRFAFVADGSSCAASISLAASTIFEHVAAASSSWRSTNSLDHC
jgi:hypothetical protein